MNTKSSAAMMNPNNNTTTLNSGNSVDGKKLSAAEVTRSGAVRSHHADDTNHATCETNMWCAESSSSFSCDESWDAASFPYELYRQFRRVRFTRGEDWPSQEQSTDENKNKTTTASTTTAATTGKTPRVKDDNDNDDDSDEDEFPPPVCSVQFIPPRSQYKTQKHQLWYSRKEMEDMKIDRAILVQQARNNSQIFKNLIRLYQTTSSENAVQRSIRRLSHNNNKNDSNKGTEASSKTSTTTTKKPEQQQRRRQRDPSCSCDSCWIRGLEKFVIPTQMRDRSIERHEDMVLDTVDAIWDSEEHHNHYNHHCHCHHHNNSDCSVTISSADEDQQYQQQSSYCCWQEQEEQWISQVSSETSAQLRVFAHRLALLGEAL